MTITCQAEGHFNEALTMICTSPKCRHQRLVCPRCLQSHHKNCAEFLLNINEAHENFHHNKNWILNKEIKEAALLINKYNLQGGQDELLAIFNELISKEFDELIQHFIQKVRSTKENLLRRARELYVTANINLEEFKEQLGSLYNVGSLIDIINHFDRHQADIAMTSRSLNAFFDEIQSKKSQEKKLQEIAQNINGFMKYYVEIDTKPFEDFKEKLLWEKFDVSPFRIWSWHPSIKSMSIALEHDFMLAQKNNVSLHYNTAVIGTMALSKGYHRWEIEINSGNMDQSWVCFGVIETNRVKEIINFPYSDCYGIDTYGRSYNMRSEGLLANYDGKVYMCELDMDNGTFTVSFQGTVLARQEGDLKGKILAPFASLGEPGNKVRLHVLTAV